MTRTVAIANSANAPVTYALSHVPAVATAGSTFTPTLLGGAGTAQFVAGGTPASLVSVPAGRSATIQVTVSPDPSLADGSVYGGYLVLTATTGATYRVPYAGAKGDYESRRVLTPSHGYPWLARRIGPTQWANRPDGDTFTMHDDDIPWVFVNLAQQARRVTISVVDAASGASWHEALREDTTIRNENADAGFALAIDATTRNASKTHTLPDGSYRAVLTVLKALGDPANPAHTETWTSPTFTVSRP